MSVILQLKLMNTHRNFACFENPRSHGVNLLKVCKRDRFRPRPALVDLEELLNKLRSAQIGIVNADPLVEKNQISTTRFQQLSNFYQK
jgi:hypothetical protein